MNFEKIEKIVEKGIELTEKKFSYEKAISRYKEIFQN